jgi:hypothetical protein
MKVFRLISLTVILVIALTSTLPAFAHGHVEVGDYEIVIGWNIEPAFQGDVNGIEFFVTNTTSDEPVTGLEETLQLEIIYGASTRELPVETQFGQEGAYIGHAIPTKAGDYTVHIWGDIEATAVDVEMTSGPDTFSPVEEKSEIAFPAADPSPSELGAQAGTAMTVGILGLIAGVAGIAIGVVALRSKKS